MNSTSSVRSFLAPRIWRQKRWILFSVGCAAILAALKPAYGHLIKSFIDQGLNSKDWSKLLASCAFLISATALDNLAEYGHRFSLRVSIERLVLLLRREVFAKFITLSQASTRDRTTGQAMTHTLQDSQVVGLGMNVLADLVREPLVLIGLLGYLFYTQWLLTLVCLVTLPFVGIVGKVFAKSARRNQSRLQSTIEHMSQHVVESVGGIRTAHHLDQSGRLMNEFEDRSGQAYRFLVKLARIEELVGPMTKWTTAWIGVVLIGFGGYLVVEGNLTTGAFVSYLMSAAFMQQPLRMLNNANVRLQQMAAAGERLQALIEQTPDLIEQEELKVLQLGVRNTTPKRQNRILKFQDVSFSYPQRPGDPSQSRSQGVEDVSFTLEVGQTTALVGPSGAGKSTVSLLAMRFIDPSKGHVWLGSTDAKDLVLNEYRSHFSYVSQDTFLFGRSLEDNLKLARPEATESEIWAALEKASCSDFVRNLPQQLKTPMAEQAKSLSGGEKQRLAIARAILKDAPILIFDEATSQLDAENEDVIQSALRGLIKNKSCLMIAHRLSTVQNANEVIVMNQGRILERGTASRLIAQQGVFFDLWKRQQSASTSGGALHS